MHFGTGSIDTEPCRKSVPLGSRTCASGDLIIDEGLEDTIASTNGTTLCANELREAGVVATAPESSITSPAKWELTP